MAGIVQNDDLTLAAALPVNFAGLVAFVGAYAVLHFFFHPLFYTNPLKRGTGPDPPVNRHNPFASLWLCICMSDDDFERYAGLDALALIEFIRLAFKVLVGYALYGLTAGLLTTWAAATYGDGTWDGPPGGLARISLANLGRFGAELPLVTWDRWLGSVGSVIGGWYLTGLTLWLLGNAWARILTRRQRSLADARDASSLVILVRETKSVPLLEKNMERRDEAFAMWRSLYPGDIYDVRMVRDTGKLPALLSKQKKLSSKVGALEASIDKLEAEGAASSKLEKKRAALETKRSAHAGILTEIRLEYDMASSPENDRGNTYFVLFRKHRPCNLAKQVVNTDEHLDIFPAPLIADVRWASLRPAAAKLALPLKLASITAYYAMLSFYILPITFVSGLLQLDQLSATFPFLEPLLESLGEAVRSAISAFLPTLALIIVRSLLAPNSPQPPSTRAVIGPTFVSSRAAVHCDPSDDLRLHCLDAGLHLPWARGTRRLRPPLPLPIRVSLLFLGLIQCHCVCDLLPPTSSLWCIHRWVFLGVTIGTSGLALVNNLQEVARNPMSILDTLGSQVRHLPRSPSCHGLP